MKTKNLICFIIFITTFFFVVYAQAEMGKGVLVKNAWVQAMPPSQKISAAYMTIANKSFKAVTIVSASSDTAGATEIHQMSDMNGMMHMAMAQNLHIPAQGEITLQPGGFHIMLINLKKPVSKGDIVPIMLHFQDGDTIIVKAEVKNARE
jgi:hypothetical protein